MIKAVFPNVPLAVVRTVIPAGSVIAAWEKFEVIISIGEVGDATVSLFTRYSFRIPRADALQALTRLAA